MTILRNSGQVFCCLSLNWNLMFFIWFYTTVTDLEKKKHRGLLYHIKCIFSTWLIKVDDLNHLAKVAFVKFLHCDVKTPFFLKILFGKKSRNCLDLKGIYTNYLELLHKEDFSILPYFLFVYLFNHLFEYGPIYIFSSVQPLSPVWLFATPWTTA